MSQVIMPDGTVRELDSLTAEERNEMFRRWEKRISRVLQDYVNQHPEAFDQLVEAFLEAGCQITFTDEEQSA